MPLANIKVIEGVFTDDEKQQMIEKIARSHRNVVHPELCQSVQSCRHGRLASGQTVQEDGFETVRIRAS